MMTEQYIFYNSNPEKENRQRETKRKEQQHESRVTNGMTNLHIALRSTIKPGNRIVAAVAKFDRLTSH